MQRLLLLLPFLVIGNSFVIYPTVFNLKQHQYQRSSSSSSSSSSIIIISGSSGISSSRLELSSTDAEPRQPREKKSVSFPKKRPPLTVADLREELLKNPAKFQTAAAAAAAAAGKSKKTTSSSKRTRQRVESPKQQYVYASQRRRQPTDNERHENDDQMVNATTSKTTAGGDEAMAAGGGGSKIRDEIMLAKAMGLIAATQHCDPDAAALPVIVGQIRVMDDDDSKSETTATSSTTASIAYIIEKPAGWSILGSAVASKQKKIPNKDPDTAFLPSSFEKDDTGSSSKRKDHYVKRIQVKDEKGVMDVLEYSELDVLALLTSEELEEYNADLLAEQDKQAVELKKLAQSLAATKINEDDVEDDVDEIIEEGKEDFVASVEHEDEELDPQTAANFRKIAARAFSDQQTAAFSTTASRPSVVSWLKDIKAAAGTPIRGGNFWTAVAGATEVDDSGLVLLCPKSNVDNIFVEYVEYFAVVGSGGHLDPSPKKLKLSDNKNRLSQEAVTMEVVSRLRKGRREDVVQTVKVVIPERKSTCAHVVDHCQEQFKEGIRGDPASNPFDRRAQRRLIHCSAIAVSSLIHDDSLKAETEGFPDDIAVLADRRNHLEFKAGSFLGRSFLRASSKTDCFREINGAADGFPGWTVDRYGSWLSVYHNPKHPRGPLPSIHDGRTTGVYYLESNPDRSTMGSENEIRPRLLEGQPAPDTLPVLENGVTFLVSLSRDLSTGIFLDQRPQRAWLTRNCCQDTRVLNCFAHTGAFSVAAAAAGASTVSLDLSKKWLERLPEQFKANSIEFDERHDCLHGDCFDWLARLAKRNEKYDIVILDPPSTSIGQKRKRWSIKDMDELVALAAGLVKKGGLLWTTTNSASMPAVKFARLCRKGLEDAGIANAKLERIQPMPADFPSIGSQPVKNLVWRIS